MLGRSHWRNTRRDLLLGYEVVRWWSLVAPLDFFSSNKDSLNVSE
jgi:hypothetical protein